MGMFKNVDWTSIISSSCEPDEEYYQDLRDRTVDFSKIPIPKIQSMEEFRYVCRVGRKNYKDSKAKRMIMHTDGTFTVVDTTSRLWLDKSVLAYTGTMHYTYFGIRASKDDSYIERFYSSFLDWWIQYIKTGVPKVNYITWNCSPRVELLQKKLQEVVKEKINSNA